jgi:dihydrofolate reductase
MRAIAAMSRNRVVGNGGAIPWHIPEEFRWFRRTTMGGAVVMGRRTFESLPKLLDGRMHVVLTREPGRVTPGPDVQVASSIESALSAAAGRPVWLCGGVQVYEQFLPRCAELYLSVVDRDVEGDAFFPRFEHLFDLAGVLAQSAEFRVLRYVRNGVDGSAS